jgi:flagellar motor switch protein FliG
MMNPSLRKAAILVTALDGAAADQLLEQMGQQQAARVRSAVMELDEVDPAEQEAVLAAFFGNAPAREAERGVELELSSESAAPLRQSSAAGSSTLGTERRFEFLQRASGDELARKLEREHPQLIAVVAAHLPAEKAAELLERFPHDLREEVLDRLTDLHETDADTLAELQGALQRMFAGAARAPRNDGPLNDHLQSILGHLRRSEQRSAAKADRPRASLAHAPRSQPTPSSAPRPAASVTREVPTIAFDQLLSLSAADFFAVFDAADPRVVMLALAGAPRRLFERYLAQFSTERALEFERHVEQLRPLRLRDVEAAQRELAILASRQLRAADSAAENSRRFAAAA